MKRLAIAILLLAACSGKSKQGTTGTGSGSAILAKKAVVSWGIDGQGTTSEVFLQITDETGAQVSHPVGTFDGECKVIQPVEEMKALTGVNCTGGTELHAIASDGSVIVLKMKVEVGVTPDPMAREEVTRVQVPTGASITAAQA